MNNTFPIVTLSNGLRVANFNSPHAFEFEDGTILSAVSNEIAEETKLDNEDVEKQHVTVSGVHITSVSKKWKMSEACQDRLNEAYWLDVDIVLVPLPVLLCLHDLNENVQNLRAIYLVDRIKKLISIDKFCI